MKGRPFAEFAVASLVGLSPAWHVAPAPGRVPNTRFSSRGAGGQSANSMMTGGPVTNGLQVLIEAQRAPIPEDQPIAIVFRVTNLGTQNFDFGWCRSSWQPNFTVAVTTDRGEPVPRSGSGLGMASFTGGRIGPRRQHVEIGDLRERYPLGAGKYYVTAIENFARGDAPPLQAVSNTIDITVVPAREISAASGLSLTCGVQSVLDPTGYADASLMLTNSGVLDIESEKWEQPWFHDVTIEVRTLSGDRAPRKRDSDGQEVPFEKNGWGLYTHRNASSGPLQPGEALDGQLLLYRLYQLDPGTAYTLAARVTLETPAGPVQIVSNTGTFVIRAR
jgi:hypothetical protein